MSVRIPLRCPAEGRTIGVVAGESGVSIDAAAIHRGYEAEDGYALGNGAVKDGVQLLCPRCHNALVAGSEQEAVYAVPGAMRFGDGGPLDGAAPG